MKKISFLITALIFCQLIIFSGCVKEEDPPSPSVGSTAGSLEDGLWIDEETFRISASGMIKEEHNTKSPVIRQEMACTAARLVAMHKIMNVFTGASTGAVTSKKKNEGSFSGTIRNGKVVEKIFNEKTNICQVTYEITDPDLKKTVMK